jgi:hypothetical protein
MDLGRREGRPCELRKRRPAPQRERRVKHGGCLLDASGLERASPIGHLTLELLEVQLLRPDVHAVSDRCRDEEARVAQRLAQRDTCTWTVFTAPVGASSPHTASDSRSALTCSLA